MKDLVGLDFTPTMEVEVEVDPKAKVVVFRSTRSTLHGNVGKPGEECESVLSCDVLLRRPKRIFCFATVKCCCFFIVFVWFGYVGGEILPRETGL